MKVEQVVLGIGFMTLIIVGFISAPYIDGTFWKSYDVTLTSSEQSFVDKYNYASQLDAFGGALNNASDASQSKESNYFSDRILKGGFNAIMAIKTIFVLPVQAITDLASETLLVPPIVIQITIYVLTFLILIGIVYLLLNRSY